jgi:protein gp37
MSTAIEWTHPPGYKGETLNPIVAYNLETGKRGWHCEHAGQGCKACYAEKMNQGSWMGWGTGLKYSVPNRAKVRIELLEETLVKPLHWRSPRCIFWCSMTDIFGEWVPDAWLDRMFAVMALTPQHIHIVLTKRVERMAAYQNDKEHIVQLSTIIPEGYLSKRFEDIETLQFAARGGTFLPNVWMGMSASRQDELDAMLPKFLQVPAAVRFLSLEPLVGPVKIGAALSMSTWGDALRGGYLLKGEGSAIHQVIVGGESGKPEDRPRPMHPDWVRSLRDECAAAGVPFFFKQWGAFTPFGHPDTIAAGLQGKVVGRTGTILERKRPYPIGSYFMEQAKGRKGGDGLLDGMRHHGWPEVLKEQHQQQPVS